MRHFFWILISLTLVSCARNPVSKFKEDQKVAWEAWKGLPTKTIEKNPYFKHLPVSKVKHPDGLETWLYRDQSRFQSDSYCQSLGGCIGMPIYNCDNVFSVKDDVILGFEQNGGCPGFKTIEVPNK